MSGSVDLGEFALNDVHYTTSPDYSSSFILRINKDEGNLKGHIVSQEGLPVSFPMMTVDATGNLIAYIALNDRIHFLGVELSPFEARSAGYLLRLSSEWDSIVNTHELIPGLFKVYPNPILEGQKLVLDIEPSFQMKNMRGMLVDAQGFVVKSFTISNKQNTISTSDLASGVYSLCVYNDGVYKSELIIIQN